MAGSNIFFAKRVAFTSSFVYNYRVLEYDDVKEFKDWYVLFDRTEEIHAWLKSQKNEKTKFRAGLYQRDEYYIYMGIRKMTMQNW